MTRFKELRFILIILCYLVVNSSFVRAQPPETLKKAVVKIRAYDNTGQIKEEGAGVVVGKEDGRIVILTAYHLVKDSAKLKIGYYNKQLDVSIGQLSYTIDNLDIGVVVVELGSSSKLYNSFPQLPKADFSQLAELERVLAIGHPIGKEWRLFYSHIESLIYHNDSRKLAIEKTALIKGGCSGGPLFDEHQNFIGILTETDASEAVVVKINEILKLLAHRGIPANLIQQDPKPIDLLTSAVVKIAAYDNEGWIKEEGAGIVVGAKDGFVFILTAYHVVKNSARLEVTFHKWQFESLKGQLYERFNDDLDIGVVIVNLQSNDDLYNSFPQLPKGDPSQPTELTLVVSIGHPYGSNWRPSSNKILSLSYEDDLQKLALTNTAIDHGYSGGPLFDEQQNLIGILTEIDPVQATAVKINAALGLLNNRGIPTNLTVIPPSPTPTPTLIEPELMIHIPVGFFWMGSDDIKDASPLKKVFLDSFSISKFEVTNEQYEIFLRNNPGYEKPPYWHNERFNAPKQPVVGVSWYDAVTYCEWLSKETNKPYRLPTEAEWEKAARGADGRKYPWGDEEPDNTRSLFAIPSGEPVSVGKYPDGMYGLKDMAGNVAEWCYDWYKKDYYKSSPAKNPPGPPEPTGPKSDPRKVVRGGSWRDTRFPFLQCASRSSYPPDTEREFIGFRVVISPLSPDTSR